jgi:hypothetical protein
MLERLLERRREPRKATYVPIFLQLRSGGDPIPAHLMDLSISGAAVVTTDQNAPMLGQHLNVEIDVPTNDGSTESRGRREAGVVVNSGGPRRGVTRIGIRFLNAPDVGCDLSDPFDWLTGHCPPAKTDFSGGRWDDEPALGHTSHYSPMAGA